MICTIDTLCSNFSFLCSSEDLKKNVWWIIANMRLCVSHGNLLWRNMSSVCCDPIMNDLKSVGTCKWNTCLNYCALFKIIYCNGKSRVQDEMWCSIKIFVNLFKYILGKNFMLCKTSVVYLHLRHIGLISTIVKIFYFYGYSYVHQKF